SASAGGYFGMMVIAELRPEFREALDGLLPGQVSPVIKISPKYVLLQVISEAETHYYRGYELGAQGNLDQAIVEFRTALQVNSDYAEAHTGLGNALALQGDLEEAIAEHRHALRLNPEYAEAHNHLGAALVELGEADEAIREYREAIRINPAYDAAHYN